MITDDIFQALPGTADVDRMLLENRCEFRIDERLGRIEERVFQHHLGLIEVLAESSKLVLFEVPDRSEPNNLQIRGTRIRQGGIIGLFEILPFRNGALRHTSQRSASSTSLTSNDLQQASQLEARCQLGQFLVSA